MSTSSEMTYAAGRLLTECLRLSPGDSFTVVADTAQEAANVDAFVAAGRTLGMDVSVALFSTRRRSQEEPSAAIAAAMRASEAYVLIPTKSIVYTEAQRLARAAGARLLVCSGLEAFVLKDIVPAIDYDEMATVGSGLVTLLDDTDMVRIVSGDDCELYIPAAGRPHFTHEGMAIEPGEEDDIPGGGAFLIPDETAAQGRLTLDASVIPSVGLIDHPIVLHVEDGRIIDIAGRRDAERLRTWLESFDDPRMFRIVELGMGLNRASKVTGRVAGVDETVFGMVHVGIGSNLAFGGSLDAPSHCDAMAQGTDVWFDDFKVINSGAYVDELLIRREPS